MKQIGVKNCAAIATAFAALAVVLVAGGCGGSSGVAKQSSSTTSALAAPVTVTETVTTTSPRASSPAEQSQPAASIDFNATADCLDQFSGSGATRGTEDGAQTAQVSIPKDSGWDTFVSVIVFVFPTAAAAKKFSKSEDTQSTIVTGNAVISGSALEIPYSKGLVLGCLKTS